MLSKNLLLAALIMLGMTTCSIHEDSICELENPVEARISGDMTEMKTRVIGDKWTYDQIGVRVLDAPISDMEKIYKNVGYETESNTTSALFIPLNPEGTIFFKDNTEIVTFAAYAPYSLTQPNMLPGNNGMIPVDTKNKNNNDGEQISINYLYATGAKASKQNPIVAFTKVSPTEDHSFKHVMSKLTLTFKSAITDGFTGDEIFTTATGSYVLGGLKLAGVFNTTTGIADATGPLVNDWDISNCIFVDNRVDKTRTYTLLLLPQDNGLNSKMSIAITVNGTTYRNTETINATLKPGMSYHYTIHLKKSGIEVSGSTITNWTEVELQEGGAISS